MTNPSAAERNARATRTLALRYLWLAIGVIINSFAIALITKSSLGTSPISSLPFVLSLAFPAVSFGVFTFFLNLACILLQVVLLRRDFQPIQLLQLAVNVVFSSAIDVSMGALAAVGYAPHGMVACIFGVVVGCALLALGICVEVAPAVILVPGEGAVRAIAAVSGQRFGTVKNCFDLSLAAVACVLSLVFFGGIRGLGLGTVLSAILVGRFCNLFNARLRFLGAIRDLARG